ncbi:glycosyltransferase [Kaistella sp. DKR-2]|uniref:glycosyltransferase family 2 protein n=1 Tax=Kaistella soli TaxID=2849654 RepID=UPI001C266E7E|nr:glycosyltransferase [Kaistella soli]MBU8883072.1 glycosyltransferase [Kaistella soli]
MSSRDISVSVCISAYNHVDFIEEALNSVLDQECDFGYEIILSNDKSTDQTHEVITKIIDNHPLGKKIRYFNQEENLGINGNLIFTLEQATGKYIALLEGDDYWLDNNKLQKQFDFLEAHPDYTLCTAAYRTVTLDHQQFDRKLGGDVKDFTYTFDTIKGFSPNYLNMFFTRQSLEVEKLKKFVYSGDNVIFLMCLSKGKIYFSNEILAFRRTHANSAWTAKSEIERKRMGVEQLIGLYKFPEFRSTIRSSLFYISLDLLCSGQHNGKLIWRSFKLIRKPNEFIYFARVLLSNLHRVYV